MLSRRQTPFSLSPLEQLLKNLLGICKPLCHTCEEQQGPLGLLANQHDLLETHGVMECHLEDPLTAGLQIDLHTIAGPAISGTHHWRLFPSSQNIEVLPVNRVTSWVRRKLWNKRTLSGDLRL